AGSLLPQLEMRSTALGLEMVGARELSQGCGQLFDGVCNRAVRHLGTEELNAAVAGASRRTLGDSWAWSRRNSAVDISPLVAVTLAHWAVLAEVGQHAHVYFPSDELPQDDLSQDDLPQDGLHKTVSPEGFRILTQDETTVVRVRPKR
ncbi:MAG: hypothetical protein ACRDWN_03185, partial [Acidimicrobiales bacterium]